LIPRIDERQQSLVKVHDKIEEHLDKLNGHLEDHSKRLLTVEVLQKERNKPSKKSIAGIITGTVAIIVAIWRAFSNGV